MSRCRYCGRPVRWVHATAGRSMPIDPEPDVSGNVLVDDTNTALVLGATSVRELDESGDARPRFLAHFVTCADYPRGQKR
jgi:hypothetical protein